jgi:hypothetical protein
MARVDDLSIQASAWNGVAETHHSDQTFTSQQLKASTEKPGLAIGGNFVKKNESAEFNGIDSAAPKYIRQNSVITRMAEDSDSHQLLVPV